MVQASISGIDQFDDLADDVESVQQRIPEAIDRATKQTAAAYIDAVTDIIRSKTTAKGGTLDSRTSPYSGGDNESQGDNLHISDRSAWDFKKVDETTVHVFPKAPVRKRAWWLEHGTRSFKQDDGDRPQYFYVNGAKIVLTDADPRAAMISSDDDADQRPDFYEAMESGTESEDPNHVTRDGVKAQRFFHLAAERLRSENVFSDKLEQEIERIFAEEF